MNVPHPAPATRHARPTPPAEPSLWLVGEHRGEVIRRGFPDGEYQVGRGSANDLVLPSQTVSRHHATLVVEGSTLHVRDLGSLNGTRVNGQGVTGSADAHPGDTVEFGSVPLRVSDRDAPDEPQWSADEHVSSQSVFLSKDEATAGGRPIAGTDPNVLRLLTEAGQLLVLPESSDRTFDRILQLVETAVPARRILLLQRDEKGKDPVQRAARVQGDRAIAPLLLSRTMMRMVLDEGAAVLIGDAQSDDRFREAQSIVGENLHSAMAVPLIHHDDVLGMLYVDDSNPLATYREDDLRLLTLLGQMLGAKLANARLLEIAREQERMQRDLDTAAAIQRRLLPQQLPEVAGYEIVAHQRTCEAVGGDLYDACVLDDGTALLGLGDVSGKGISAALLMSDVLATIRALRTVVGRADEIVARLDRHLLQSTQEEHYLTLFLAELDPAAHRLAFVNAGHPPAYLVHPDGRVDALDSTAHPVGLVDMPGLTFERRERDFPAGAALVVYSDGLSEAERGTEQLADRRLAEVLPELAGGTARGIVDRLETELAAWVGNSRATDDVTLLVIRRAPA